MGGPAYSTPTPEPEVKEEEITEEQAKEVTEFTTEAEEPETGGLAE